MLTAYNLIFTTIPYVVAVIVGIAFLTVFLLKSSLIIRSILFSFGFWLSPLFYIIYLVFTRTFSAQVVIALLLEVLFFVLYLKSFSILLTLVTTSQSPTLRTLKRWLKAGLLLSLVLVAPLIFHAGYGLFSHTSRIQYLADSRLNLYLTYTSSLTAAIMIPIMAAILNREKRWSAIVVFYLAIEAVLSVLSGSKGGSVLAFVAVLSLLQYQSTREYFKLLRIPAVIITAIIGSTIYYVGGFLHLDPIQMIRLMGYRFFLTNDARALSIDFAGHLDQASTSLFRESFRFYASFLGLSPINPPLGQLLYTQAFSTVGLLGANTSATALLIAYGGDLERVLFAFGLSLAAICIWLAIGYRNKYQIVSAAAGISLLSLLSQDFLAFQVTINIVLLVCILAIVLLVVRRCLVLASHT
jgi:hypothetical protein